MRPQVKFADLKILRTLGTGMFGRVKLVQDTQSEADPKATYALKILQKGE